ncbi:unnamed protein product [Cylicostephanus goldi]|uniref:Uncharacterized protein n=1 Tax=Cylicostephanus goldi TaxID=71465 RepID=A0A3P6RA83_CYLGO|nr:unnamed protein product [Cylicostephanus goldi]
MASHYPCKNSILERERKRAERKLMKKEEKKKKEAEKTPEQIRIEHEMAYQAREAKRARRGKMTRLRAVVETSAKKKVGMAKKRSMKLSDIPAIEVEFTLNFFLFP